MTTIKKIILLALTVLMMVECDDWNSDYVVNTKKDGILYGVIVIDTCEYIRGSDRLAHKGNCHFCKKRDSIKWENRKKELEELIIKLKEE